jgi:uncharacterized protein (DUF1015 family)
VPHVAPFRALVYDTAVTGPLDLVTAPPYDVISEGDRTRYLGESPYNVVHLDLSEGGEDPADPGNRYERAATLLRSWRGDGALRLTPPSAFAYEVKFHVEHRRRSVRGLLCAMTLEPWGGRVVPHEETMRGPLEDRLRLLRATRTHLSPIYGTVAGPCPTFAALLETVVDDPPGWRTIDEEGVEHRMWPLPADVPIDAWFADESLLIADGHHRYTTALSYAEERRAQDGPGPWDRILTLIVDSGTEDVTVFPYHRVQVRGPVVERGDPVPDLHAVLHAVDDTRSRVGVAVRDPDGQTHYRVLHLEGDPPSVSALHDEVLDGAAPGDALWFTHDADTADDAVRDGSAVAAYFLPPTTPERIRAVIARGARLPRKSTFFWPKPRTGMVMMPLDL